MIVTTDSRPTVSDVVATYHVMLGRDPESGSAIDNHLQAKDAAEMLKSIADSREFRDRVGFSSAVPSPFLHVNSEIDVQGMIRSNVDADRKPVDGCYVNFLGVSVPTFVFDFLHDKGGLLDEVPLPANYHADMAEWAAAIRPIDLARGKFTMIELGCGWGCWMVNTGVLAKRRGLAIDVIGIEGNSKHVAFAEEVMKINNIRPDEYTIVRGIAASKSGVALFPKGQGGKEHWGFAPIFGANAQETEAAVKAGSHDRLEMVPLDEIIGDRTFVDLLHIDIQGGETDLVEGTIKTLNEKVGYVLIGTHSRVIEGRLMDFLLDAGWALEIERPAIFTVPDGIPQITCDGVQGWRNRKFHG